MGGLVEWIRTEKMIPLVIIMVNGEGEPVPILGMPEFIDPLEAKSILATAIDALDSPNRVSFFRGVPENQ